MIDKSNIVFTRCADYLEEKYQGIFVSSEKLIAPSEFPAVGIVQLGSPSISELLNDTQAYCISTFEVEVYSTKSASEAKSIIADTIDLLSKMGYRLTYGAENLTQQTDIHRFIARLERIIGSGDFF